MGVPAQRQRHPVGHSAEDVGLVRHHQDGRVRGALLQRSAEVVGAAGLAEADSVGHLIGQSGEPEWPARLLQRHRPIFQHLDPDPFERTPHLGRTAGHAGQGTMPPVVVAQDRIDAERRPQHRERLSPVLGQNRTGDDLVPGVVVAEQQDQIGLHGVHTQRDGPDPLRGHPGFASMDVGDDGDFEPERLWPVRRRQRVACHARRHERFPGHGVGSGPDAAEHQRA